MNLTYIFFIILAALWLFMFFYLKWYVKKRTSVLEQLEDYRTEVIKLNAEIDRITDRDSQLIEDRVKKLKEILEETDRRVSVYASELEKSRRGEALYTSLSRGIRDALEIEKEPAQPAPRLSPVHPQELASLKQPVPPAPRSVPETPAAKEPPPSKPPSKRQIRSSIDLLLNEGLSPEQVASRLDISVAEVNLAVNLRRTKS